MKNFQQQNSLSRFFTHILHVAVLGILFFTNSLQAQLASLELQDSNLDLITSPLAGEVGIWYALANSDQASTKVLATFSSGAAEYSVNGGAAVALTSGALSDAIALSNGPTPAQSETEILVRHTSSSSVVTEYKVRVRRAYELDQDPEWLTAEGGPLSGVTRVDGEKSTWSVVVPYEVETIQTRVTLPADSVSGQKYAASGEGKLFGSAQKLSGETHSVRFAWGEGAGVLKIRYRVWPFYGTGQDSIVPETNYYLKATRLPAFSEANLSSLELKESNLSLITSPLNGEAGIWYALASSDQATTKVSATFVEGTAEYSVNGGASVTLSSGVLSEPIALSNGPTPAQSETEILVRHTSSSSVVTEYKVRVRRAYELDQDPEWLTAEGDPLSGVTRVDGEKNTWSVVVPYEVETIQTLVTLPAESVSGQKYAASGEGKLLGSAQKLSGETHSVRFAWGEGAGVLKIRYRVWPFYGTGQDSIVPETNYYLKATRLPAFSEANLSSLELKESNLSLINSPLSGEAGIWYALASSDQASTKVSATFVDGTAEYSVNGGAAVALSSGDLSESIALSNGPTPAQSETEILVRHTSSSSVVTEYKVRVRRAYELDQDPEWLTAEGDPLSGVTRVDGEKNTWSVVVPYEVETIQTRVTLPADSVSGQKYAASGEGKLLGSAQKLSGETHSVRFAWGEGAGVLKIRYRVWPFYGTGQDAIVPETNYYLKATRLPPFGGIADSIAAAADSSELRNIIEDPNTGLDLTEYNTLQEIQKAGVMDSLYVKAQNGFASFQELQAGLDNAVATEKTVGSINAASDSSVLRSLVENPETGLDLSSYNALKSDPMFLISSVINPDSGLIEAQMAVNGKSSYSSASVTFGGITFDLNQVYSGILVADGLFFVDYDPAQRLFNIQEKSGSAISNFKITATTMEFDVDADLLSSLEWFNGWSSMEQFRIHSGGNDGDYKQTVDWILPGTNSNGSWFMSAAESTITIGTSVATRIDAQNDNRGYVDGLGLFSEIADQVAIFFDKQFSYGDRIQGKVKFTLQNGATFQNYSDTPWIFSAGRRVIAKDVYANIGNESDSISMEPLENLISGLEYRETYDGGSFPDLILGGVLSTEEAEGQYQFRVDRRKLSVIDGVWGFLLAGGEFSSSQEVQEKIDFWVGIQTAVQQALDQISGGSVTSELYAESGPLNSLTQSIALIPEEQSILGEPLTYEQINNLRNTYNNASADVQTRVLNTINGQRFFNLAALLEATQKAVDSDVINISRNIAYENIADAVSEAEPNDRIEVTAAAITETITVHIAGLKLVAVGDFEIETDEVSPVFKLEADGIELNGWALKVKEGTDAGLGVEIGSTSKLVSGVELNGLKFADYDRAVVVTNGQQLQMMHCHFQGNRIDVDSVSANEAMSIQKSSFSGSEFGILHAGSSSLQASWNYWGAESGPAHSSNPAGTGAVVSGNVELSPWYSDASFKNLYYAGNGTQIGNLELMPEQILKVEGTWTVGNGVDPIEILVRGKVDVGQLALQPQAVLNVLDGSLVLGTPDNGAHEIRGTFKIFNSWKSIEIQEDTQFIGDTLALISEFNISDGTLLTVDGSLTLDGCMLYSAGRFNIQVNQGSSFKMVRTFLYNADVAVSNTDTRIVDNILTGVKVDFASGTDGAHCYHNILFPGSGSTITEPASSGVITEWQGWGNVDNLNTVKNLFALEIDTSVLPDGRGVDSLGQVYIQPGDPVSGRLKLKQIGQYPIQGAEFMMGFNSRMLNTNSLEVTRLEPWTQPLYDKQNFAGSYGMIDTSIGLKLGALDQSGTKEDSNIMSFTIDANEVEGESAFFFRLKQKEDPAFLDTRLTAMDQASPFYLKPFTWNSQRFTIDGTSPEITGLEVTQEQSGINVDMLQPDTIVRNEIMLIQFDTFDALSEIQEDRITLTLKHKDIQGAELETALKSNETVIVDDQVRTRWIYEVAIQPVSINGVYNIELQIRDLAGNLSEKLSNQVLVEKSKTTFEIFIAGLVNTTLERTVTIVGLDETDSILREWNPTVQFLAQTGKFAVYHIPEQVKSLVIKPDYGLSRHVVLDVDENAQGSVTLTGEDGFLTGDINEDDRVDQLDFALVRFHWNTTNTAADINGDGITNLTDFNVVRVNWFTSGEAPFEWSTRAE